MNLHRDLPLGPDFFIRFERDGRKNKIRLDDQLWEMTDTFPQMEIFKTLYSQFRGTLYDRWATNAGFLASMLSDEADRTFRDFDVSDAESVRLSFNEGVNLWFLEETAEAFVDHEKVLTVSGLSPSSPKTVKNLYEAIEDHVSLFWKETGKLNAIKHIRKFAEQLPFNAPSSESNDFTVVTEKRSDIRVYRRYTCSSKFVMGVAILVEDEAVILVDVVGDDATLIKGHITLNDSNSIDLRPGYVERVDNLERDWERVL